MKTFLELYDELNEKPKGLYYYINKKRKEGRKMRKKGEKGAPKASDFERAAQTAKESVQEDDHTAVAKVKSDIKDRKETFSPKNENLKQEKEEIFVHEKCLHFMYYITRKSNNILITKITQYVMSRDMKFFCF